MSDLGFSLLLLSVCILSFSDVGAYKAVYLGVGWTVCGGERKVVVVRLRLLGFERCSEEANVCRRLQP